MKKGFWVVVLLSVVIAVSAGQAGATPILKLNDPGTVGEDVLVTDQGVGDSSALEGVIVFNGAIGNWIVNVTTGITKPIIGGVANPKLDLNSVNVTGISAGSLEIAFTETGFEYAGGLGTDVGGTTNGSVNFLISTGDEEFGNSGIEYSLGPFAAGAFSGTAGGVADLSSSDWVTIKAFINHTGAGQVTSFDAAVPEPGTMMLLGSGLIGLAAFGRKKIRK